MDHPYICIAGKNNIAVEILEYVIEKYGKDKVCVICNRTETGANGFQRSLRFYAQSFGIPELTLEDVYNIEDLVFLSLEFDRIVKPNLFKEARLYNIHFSLLPRYKGMYTAANHILNGERYSGVTLHYIDAGIDTGDIIDQEKFEIGDSDCEELYIKYIKYGTEVVKRNIENIIWNRTIAKPQDSRNSSYYSKKSIIYSQLSIDLNQTAEGIRRQLKAYSFREYQLPKLVDRAVIDSKTLSSRSILKPGEVVFLDSDSVVFSTIDYDIVAYFDRFGELMEACERGEIDKVIKICSVEKHVNSKDSNGWSPIIKATFFNHESIVKYLISVGADIHTKNNNGTNLLMYAKEAYKRTGDNRLFRLYINMGLSVEERDYYNKNLLDYIRDEKIELAELIQ